MNFFSKSLTSAIFALLLNSGFIGVGTSGIISFNAPVALAAEEVIFYDGIASQSVSLTELENFAKTGKISSSLKFLFDSNNQNPQLARYILNQEFSVDTIWVANLVNSKLGAFVLGETREIVHSKSKQASASALRGSLLLSASDDRKISLLEILQNYPTQQVYVNGAILSQIFQH